MADLNQQDSDNHVPYSGGESSGGPLASMFREYYLDYASYVICERAIPHLDDGLKPVQRRILYSLFEMEDGRYNKVANVIGHCMRYHPHGDAAISDAMVHIGQKGLLIDTQGNWGHPVTGDRAAAARYIEARLTAFAKEVLFQPKITTWQSSYDGRFREPITLPVKFPLVLFGGAEGIAVGLATKILPHNFCELLQACISSLKGQDVTLYPDFYTGGVADVSDYNNGKRGGRVRVRAKIEIMSSKSLVIKEIPFETTTQSLIDSILQATDKGHLKIKKIENNTTSDVEIIVHLKPGEQAMNARDALYAFTKCEVSLASNICVISDGKPQFLDTTSLVRYSANRTQQLLASELRIKKKEIEEKIFFLELERLFIEKKVYKVLEKCKSKDDMLSQTYKKLKPLVGDLYRALEDRDIHHLIEIPIRRISLFDAEALEKKLALEQKELRRIKRHLSSLKQYTISYFDSLLKTYGKDFPRKTTLSSLSGIDKAHVAAASEKVYVERKEGFVGTSLKKEEYLFECSSMAEILCVTRCGLLKVVSLVEKVYVGKNIISVSLFKRGDKTTTYHLIYSLPDTDKIYVKRCHIPAITRDREYSLTQGHPKAKVLYFLTTKDAGEAPRVRVHLSSKNRSLRKKMIEHDFATMPVRNRDSAGHILTKHRIAKIVELSDKN
ncbi:MAG: DNA gyrase/topoisomerase IV subunit A [Proteobacteria bacterium]|nr:DNA gyrase/topoisomerase IV subunit A [Pseudomonadota bacterium]